MKDSLYFIAVVPNEGVSSEVESFKKEVAEKFGSNHALRSPPHITLHMPFKWKNHKELVMLDLIGNLNDEITPFQIELNGFDFFEPRVVFVNVEENKELENLQSKVVRECRKKLNLDNANYKDRPFHPHMTIGFRDLKKPAFYQAKAYYENKTYFAQFELKKITLLKHDGKKWQVINLRN